MANWELCPKCKGQPDYHSGVQCPVCNGTYLISSFTGLPPMRNMQQSVTTNIALTDDLIITKTN